MRILKKKYQICISSISVDLIEERYVVLMSDNQIE